LVGGHLIPCEPNAAEIIAYTSPTMDDEAELQEQYKIDYHTLQSSLDPDELSRLEIEHGHISIIFKRPKSFCAGDNFLMKLTSTGVFVYKLFGHCDGRRLAHLRRPGSLWRAFNP
jgi:magnesium transporter